MVKFDGGPTGFDRLLHYFDHFIAWSYYPGWIVQAQFRLCDAIDKVNKIVADAGASYPCYIHFTRATETFTVYNADKREIGTIPFSEV